MFFQENGLLLSHKFEMYNYLAVVGWSDGNFLNKAQATVSSEKPKMMKNASAHFIVDVFIIF